MISVRAGSGHVQRGRGQAVQHLGAQISRCAAVVVCASQSRQPPISIRASWASFSGGLVAISSRVARGAPSATRSSSAPFGHDRLPRRPQPSSAAYSDSEGSRRRQGRINRRF